MSFGLILKKSTQTVFDNTATPLLFWICHGTVNKSEEEDSSAVEGEYLLINENKTQKQKPTRGKTYFIKT